jgi:hypothetical protein
MVLNPASCMARSMCAGVCCCFVSAQNDEVLRENAEPAGSTDCAEAAAVAHLFWVRDWLSARLQGEFRGYLQQLQQEKLQEVLRTELGMPVLGAAAAQTATG